MNVHLNKNSKNKIHLMKIEGNFQESLMTPESKLVYAYKHSNMPLLCVTQAAY